MGARIVWLLLGLLSFPGAASAESSVRPGELIRQRNDGPGLYRLLTTPSEWPTNFGLPGPARGPGSRDGNKYRSLLRSLVVTRDLKLPGAPFLGLRMIPLRRELGGDSRIPIVVKPRFIATSWYGLDVTARF